MNLRYFLRGKTVYVINFVLCSLLLSAQTTAESKDSSNIFHASKAYKIQNKNYDHVTVIINDKIDLTVKGCASCDGDKYQYHEFASNVIGKGVYQLSETDYIIQEEEGLLIWAKFKKGLGKKAWSRLDPYNILAKDRSYVRQLYTNAKMQNDIKKTLIAYSRNVKKKFAQAKAENKLTMR